MHFNYFADSPVYTVEPIFSLVEGSTNTRINLILDANPIPPIGNFTWFFNDEELFEDGNINFGVDYIEIGMLSSPLNGTYQVVGENTAGTGRATFQINVICKRATR